MPEVGEVCVYVEGDSCSVKVMARSRGRPVIMLYLHSNRSNIRLHILYIEGKISSTDMQMTKNKTKATTTKIRQFPFLKKKKTNWDN